MNYLADRILYQIFKVILNISKTEKISIKISINKIENMNMLEIKTGYYLKLLTPETMKLLGSNISKTTNYKNGENVPNLEIIEVV